MEVSLIVLMIIALLTLLLAYYKFDLICKENFQDYIYIPPQSVISTYDDSYSQFLMAMMPYYGGYFGGYQQQQPQQPQQYIQPRNPPATTKAVKQEQPPATTQAVKQEQPPATTQAVKQEQPPAQTPTPTQKTPAGPAIVLAPALAGEISSTPIPANGKINMVTNPTFKTPKDAVGLTNNNIHESGSWHVSEENGFIPSRSGLETAFSKVFPGVNIQELKTNSTRFYGYEGWKDISVYNLMLLAMRLKVVPIEQWETNPACVAECLPASRCYGPLKYFAMEGNLPKLKAKLIECGGGKWIEPLTDDDLMWIFGSNEHRNLHTSIIQNGEQGAFYHASHIGSLNYLADFIGKGGSNKLGWHGGNNSSGTEILGAFNDTGLEPQWGWYVHAKKARKDMFPTLGLR